MLGTWFFHTMFMPGLPLSAPVRCARVTAKLPHILSRLIAGTVVLGCGVWLLGRILTDRWWATQYIAWVPSLAVVALGVAAASLSMLIAHLSRDRNRRWRHAATLAVTLCTGVLLLADWRVQGFAQNSAGPGPIFKVAIWNPSQWNQRAVPICVDRTTDLALIANPSPYLKWSNWFEAMSPSTPGPPPLSPSPLSPPPDGSKPDRPIQLILAGRLAILSRSPVLRWGSVYYVSRGVPADRKQILVREGSFMFVEIDTTATLGRPIVIWFVDFPSDPWVHKTLLVQEVLDYARNWQGPEFYRVASGMDRTRAPTSKGFPLPDVVTGDFNIPRGSYSLSLFRDPQGQPLRNAYGDAGKSLGMFNAASFSRRWPLWHIDNTLLGTDLLARDYDLIDPGESRHRMQIMELQAKAR